MVPSRLPFVVALAGLLLLMSGCASVQRPELPKPLPVAFRAQAAVDTAVDAAANGAAFAPDLQSWWKTFNDPVLDALVERSLAQNLNLAQARSRLRQARLLNGRDQNQYKPTLNGSIQTVQDVAAVDSYFHAGVDATWELGLFGAREAVRQGGAARLDLADAGEQAARVSTVAEVVRRYLELKTARRDEAALQQLLAVDERLLALQAVRQRSHVGVMDERRAVELRQLQTRALLPAPRQAAAQAEQALAVLLGQTETEPAWAGAVDSAVPPVLPPLALTQVPADLLRFRPDIRAAEAEVDKATGELGMARAELYPRVALGLSFLYAYNVTQNRRNVNSNLPAFGPIIDIPLFDWSRRRAAADAREEGLNGALLAYRQTVIEAYGETESALSTLAQSGEREQALLGLQRLAQQGLALQTTRQRFGLTGEVERLEAERSGLQADTELAAARSARAMAFVALYKSLGGAPLASVAEGDGKQAAATAANIVGRAP